MDPLSAIGGASAVISLIETGFSFAQALHDYAKAVQKVPDEIVDLPDRLFETVGLVEEVNNLLALNSQTNAWSVAGVRRAEGDIVYCHKIITPLQELLQKASVPPQSKITKDDLVLSTIDKFSWPFLYASKVERTKQDLHKFYSRVSVTILTYQVRTSTSHVQKIASEKRLAKLLAAEMPGAKPSGGKYSPNRDKGLKDAVHRYQQGQRVGSYAGYRTGSPASEPYSTTEDNLTKICQALKEVTRAELAREDAAAKTEEERRKQRDAEAVAKWQADAQQRWQAEETRRAQLRSELSGRLEPSTINAVVSNLFPGTSDVGLEGYTKSPAPPTASSQLPARETANASKSASGRKLGWFPRAKSRVAEIDPELQAMISPRGRQFLRGFVFSYDKEQRIQTTPMTTPQHVLLSNASTSAGRSKSTLTPWESYGLLPSALRQAIDAQRKRLAKGGDKQSYWVVVHLERILMPQKRRLLGKNVEQVQGAYAIFRQVEPYSKVEQGPLNDAHDDHESIATDSAGSVIKKVAPDDARFQDEVNDILRPPQDRSSRAYIRSYHHDDAGRRGARSRYDDEIQMQETKRSAAERYPRSRQSRRRSRSVAPSDPSEPKYLRPRSGSRHRSPSRSLSRPRRSSPNRMSRFEVSDFDASKVRTEILERSVDKLMDGADREGRSRIRRVVMGEVLAEQDRQEEARDNEFQESRSPSLRARRGSTTPTGLREAAHKRSRSGSRSRRRNSHRQGYSYRQDSAPYGDTLRPMGMPAHDSLYPPPAAETSHNPVRYEVRSRGRGRPQRRARVHEDSNIYHSPDSYDKYYDTDAGPEIAAYGEGPVTGQAYGISERSELARSSISRRSRHARIRTDRRASDAAAANNYGGALVEDEVARLMSELTTTGHDAAATSQGASPPPVVNHTTAGDVETRRTDAIGAAETTGEPNPTRGVVEAAPVRTDTLDLTNAEAGGSRYRGPTTESVVDADQTT